MPILFPELGPAFKRVHSLLDRFLHVSGVKEINI
jgi:hypothetical protein